MEQGSKGKFFKSILFFSPASTLRNASHHVLNIENVTVYMLFRRYLKFKLFCSFVWTGL
jgi:hypothetical protein